MTSLLEHPFGRVECFERCFDTDETQQRECMLRLRSVAWLNRSSKTGPLVLVVRLENSYSYILTQALTQMTSNLEIARARTPQITTYHELPLL